MPKRYVTELPTPLVRAIDEMAARFDTTHEDILVTALVPFLFGRPPTDADYVPPET